MRTMSRIPLIVLLATFWFVSNASPPPVDPLGSRVDELIHRHYLDGIPYGAAHELGPDAVPYLVDLLNDPQEEPFWVNAIVTLGFIESSSARDSLIHFLEKAHGEVDAAWFRALLSVPFALGCIASNGDPIALAYLVDLVRVPSRRPVQWRFGHENIDHLLAEKSVVGLAVSGRSEARSRLVELKGSIESGRYPHDRRFLLDIVRSGLKLMDRIDAEGRSGLFNPQRGH